MRIATVWLQVPRRQTHEQLLRTRSPRDGLAHAQTELRNTDTPPVEAEPMRVRLKPGVTPVRAKPRRYSPLHCDFLDRYTDTLLTHGLVYMNHRSRRSSAPRNVGKRKQESDPSADPRLTIDSRGVNERTEPMSWSKPILEVAIGVVEEIFGDLLGNGILAWLDNILEYAKDEEALQKLLDQVLVRCEKYGLKLHAKKCRFFTRKVKWCGKIISAEGVGHCPDRVQGLVDMRSPATAGDLQQFLCTVNWMRQSISEYARVIAALYAALERAMKAAGSRKKTKLQKFQLADLGWSENELQCLASIRDFMLSMVPLAHPAPQAEVCLYTDASQDCWGAVATQLEPREAQLPLSEQNHRLLAFLSGRFAGSASRWPTVEKEAFAIVEATRRLEYLLLRRKNTRNEMAAGSGTSAERSQQERAPTRGSDLILSLEHLKLGK